MDNMTALVSCFARAYCYKNSEGQVFADSVAERMLAPEEYDAISRNMAQGIRYFAPNFRGTPEEALRFIVNRQLAPSVLVRSAFCEGALDDALRRGCRQVVIYACGYDTFSLRTDHRAITVYELDRPEMIADRRERVARGGIEPVCRVKSIGCDLSRPAWKDRLIEAGFDVKRSAFSSLLGISYYLTREAFESLIAEIASISCEGASIGFDYPMDEDGVESAKNRELAAVAGEAMKARYARREMEALLSRAGFSIREHMGADEATEAFFRGSTMSAPMGVGYCLAVRK